MKFPAEQFGQLSEAIAEFDTPERRSRYLAGDFPRSDSTKDLNMRYRWDLYWVARPTFPREWMRDMGLIDSHIDTALRKIVPLL